MVTCFNIDFLNQLNNDKINAIYLKLAPSSCSLFVFVAHESI